MYDVIHNIILLFYIILYTSTSNMISILSCENTCPHGDLRSTWIPWDMGPGGPGSRVPAAPRTPPAAAGPRARDPGAPGPMSQGIQGLLRPPCGHVFSQESMEIILDVFNY